MRDTKKKNLKKVKLKTSGKKQISINI